ncbi:hypothetical protein BD413DRAFT_69329 [Trametes elegans]|nr:hypothetical protein BD413DRAFT_69329 [Trametes elegans]
MDIPRGHTRRAPPGTPSSHHARCTRILRPRREACPPRLPQPSSRSHTWPAPRSPARPHSALVTHRRIWPRAPGGSLPTPPSEEGGTPSARTRSSAPQGASRELNVRRSATPFPAPNVCASQSHWRRRASTRVRNPSFESRI